MERAVSLADAILAQQLLVAFEKINVIDERTQGILDQQQEIGEQVATLAENLTALGDAVTGLEDDVNRVIAALEDEELSPETQAAVDALKTRLATVNTQMDTAVPPTTTPPPADF
jgi:uncharacterized protein YoxC